MNNGTCLNESRGEDEKIKRKKKKKTSLANAVDDTEHMAAVDANGLLERSDVAEVASGDLLTVDNTTGSGKKRRKKKKEGELLKTVVYQSVLLQEKSEGSGVVDNTQLVQNQDKKNESRSSEFGEGEVEVAECVTTNDTDSTAVVSFMETDEMAPPAARKKVTWFSYGGSIIL